MKINWKVRLKNPYFIVQIILAIGAPLLAYYGLTAQDLTTWGSVFNLIWDALSNPYVLGLIFVSVFNALNDPVVEGLSDSEQALRYQKPKKRGLR
ncbi:phage holin [Sporosarcina sp. OR05]|uniref:phage holin n=1 Tax=Sporosarcina sp. OR05 TaxID=2969819 RepID=UPI00352B67CD